MEYILGKFSHELRNPLTSVYSTVQLIEMQHPEVKDFKYWSNLAHDLEYMNRLLTELSDFSKSERLDVSAFSFRALLEQISLSFAATIANSEVEYTSKISPSIHQIIGDKTKLQEVFLNLLKNAYDASLPNKTIYLEASCDDCYIHVRIRDTGCGISEKQLPTIFDPFVTYKQNGSGLGLAICNNIIHAHGGSISVESALNVGTTFHVRLPLNYKSF